jgi:hypothetical protein
MTELLMFRRIALACTVPAVLALVGCVSKSQDPLSPTVAGPIPGVNITPPGIMKPATGTKVAVDQQPLVLTVFNAGTSGVRPLTYVFEVAADASFANKLFTTSGIQPGATGQTSVRLPDPLATGRTYFWHARAEDGANTGPFSATAAFDVFTPTVIGAPVPLAPINNALVDSAHPRFYIGNVARTGTVSPLTYTIEVADSDSFLNKLAIWTVAEQGGAGGQTVLDSPQDLPPIKQLFWRSRAADSVTAGPWASPQAFQTPVPVVLPPPLPPDVPNGPTPGDALNLGAAGVYNSPPDIASWPATAKITRIDMSPGAGLNIEFTTKASWPDYTPPGWDGPLQYTVWAVVNISGRWYTSGFIQMWRGRAGTGAPIISDFARNWAYDSRWGPMMGHQPVPGEQMGFFVSAGNARGEVGVTSRRERSNVVIVSLPAGDSGSFPFSLAPVLLRSR